MPIGPARMPLSDHLGELRRRLLIVVVSLAAATLVLYFATPTIVEILEEPIYEYVEDGEFYITTSLGGFNVKFGIAFKCAIMVCTPMILWQVLGFFLPALKENERKWVVPTVLIATVLFFVGMLFAYFIAIPTAFEWLIGQTSDIATALPDLEDYVNIEILLMIGFGIIFELPLVIFYLTVFHIVPYATFRSAWRYVYVILIVVCACVTPDGSPVTLLIMYAVMLLMYELSLAVSRFVIMRREGPEGLSKSAFAGLTDDEDEEAEEAAA